MNKKNICIVSPSLKMGGIERALTVLANYFSSLGHRVYFVSAQGGEKFYELDSAIEFFEPKLSRKPGIIGKVKVYLGIISFIKKTVLFLKPDVVLSFGDAFNPLVLFALRSTNVPIYISDRTSPDFRFNHIIRIGKKFLYPKSAGFIAQTQRAADYKIKQFNNSLNIKVIPNALKEIRTNNITKKNIILCVGRLSIEKGQDRLIEAFAKLNDVDDWELLLAGSGPMLDALVLMTEKLEIFHKVKFLGKVNNVDILLSEASIFVLPSRLEGFPNALCEAMASGLPCICFDSIPTEAILENKTDGIIVKEDDIDDLTKSMRFLIMNEAERNRLGKNAMKIKDKLNVEKVGNEFLSFMFQ